MQAGYAASTLPEPTTLGVAPVPGAKGLVVGADTNNGIVLLTHFRLATKQQCE
jgi:hypothetical protein